MIPTASLLPRPALDSAPPDSATLTRTPSWARTLLGYAAAAGLAVALMVVTLKLWKADLRASLYYEHDGIYYLSIIKTVVETGWYYHNDRIGQLGGLDYREFPTADGWLHMGIIKALAAVVPDPFVVMNLFYLLTFPLTALTALYACRRLGLGYPVALAVSLLFTFIPFHLLRIGHIFLVAYYLVPLSALLVLRVYQGNLPFRHGEGDAGRWRLLSLPAFGAALLAVMIGMGGVYYAFFTCFFLAVVAAARAYAERSWRPVVSAGAVGGIVFAALLVTLWPAIEYKLTQPRNSDTTQRCAWESEVYALKVAQLVLPVTEHRYGAFRHLKARYNRSGTPLVNENDHSSLGLVGACGFLFLLGRLILRRSEGKAHPLDGLALVTAFAVLLATVGGLGSVFATLFSPWIRAYNRISVFIAFFALLAVGYLLHRLGQRWAETRRGRVAFPLLLAGLVTLGVLDQTNAKMVPDYARLNLELEHDRSFVERVEAIAPQKAIVFQLPYRPYPETVPEPGFGAYDLLRPYLHSKHLRWTYGGIKGHRGDEWAKRLTKLPAGDLVDRLAEAEIAGVCVDRAGYKDRGQAVEQELERLLGPATLVSDGGRHAYYDLSAHTAKLRAARPDWEARRERAQNPIVPLWRNGFFMYEDWPDIGPGHWAAKSAEIHLDNPLSYPRRVRLQLTVELTGRPEPSSLRMSGVWEEEVAIDRQPRTLERVVTLAPGRNVVRLECDAAPVTASEDPLRRRLSYRAANLVCEELP